MKDLNLYNYTEKRGANPVFSGIYHNIGYKIASDRFILIALKSEYNENLEGKILAKDGAFIDGRYPNWLTCIPKKEDTTFTKNIDFSIVKE